MAPCKGKTQVITLFFDPMHTGLATRQVLLYSLFISQFTAINVTAPPKMA